jgi:hypothetical protein
MKYYDTKIKKTFILLTLSLMGCGMGQDNARKNNPNTDSFYIEVSGFDWSRFPLIKPYEILTLDRGDEWTLGFRSKEVWFNTSVANVRKVDVKEALIFAYGSDSTFLNNHKVYEAWFVINQKTKKEKGFATETEFLTYLKRKGIDKPQWHEVNVAYRQFLNTYCLDWIPGCKKL